MKKMTWFLYIAIIAVTGILIGFTGYTTDPVKTTTVVGSLSILPPTF